MSKSTKARGINMSKIHKIIDWYVDLNFFVRVAVTCAAITGILAVMAAVGALW